MDKGRILIIDDEEQLRSLLSFFLKSPVQRKLVQD